MNHAEAVRSQAAERYLLCSLENAARDEFEEHFFECELCADDIRSGVLLMDNAAAEFGAQRGIRDTSPVQSERDVKVGKRLFSWLDWLQTSWARPAFALSFAALTIVSGLWVRDAQQLRKALAEATGPQVFTYLPVESARGERHATVSHGDRFLAVSFYLDPDTLPTYTVEISGNGVAPSSVQAAQRPAGKSYNILLPADRYKPGHYEFRVLGGPAADGRIVKQFGLDLQ